LQLSSHQGIFCKASVWQICSMTCGWVHDDHGLYNCTKS
jgi:hypothetical protein